MIQQVRGQVIHEHVRSRMRRASGPHAVHRSRQRQGTHRPNARQNAALNTGCHTDTYTSPSTRTCSVDCRGSDRLARKKTRSYSSPSFLLPQRVPRRERAKVLIGQGVRMSRTHGPPVPLATTLRRCRKVLTLSVEKIAESADRTWNHLESPGIWTPVTGLDPWGINQCPTCATTTTRRTSI
jgi:hypothetical protein